MQLRMVARRSLSGLDDGGRRHRPGHRHLGAGFVVPGGRAPSGPPGLAAGRADRQLPHAPRDHGDGGPDPRAGGPGHASSRCGAVERPAAPNHPGRPCRPARSPATPSSALTARVVQERARWLLHPGRTGTVAVIVPPTLLDPVASALSAAGLTVRAGWRAGPGRAGHLADHRGRQGPRVRLGHRGRTGPHRPGDPARVAGPLRGLHPGHPDACRSSTPTPCRRRWPRPCRRRPDPSARPERLPGPRTGPGGERGSGGPARQAALIGSFGGPAP